MLCASSGSPKDINLSLFTGFMRIMAAKQLAAKFELRSLNTKRFLGWGVGSETVTSQETVELLGAKMRERKYGNLASIFASSAPSLLRQANKKQVHQILWASTVIHIYTASGVHLRERFFWLF